jgi:hypothetical protein
MAITGSQKAYLYALSNVARSGASRSGYVSNTIFISIGGVPITPTGDPPNRKGMAYSSLQITDNLDEAANRCTFRLFHTVPTQGQEVILTLGSKNTLDRLFAGHVVETTQGYQGKPANAYTDVAAVDYTWQLGFALVTERFVNYSATIIADYLVSVYGSLNGFTSVNVARDLPTINEITFTNEDLPACLTRLARRLGAYWYVDYQKDVHLFIGEDTSRVAPTDLTPTHPSFNDFTHEVDTSQTLSLVYVEGRGTTVISAVSIGDTQIPVEAVDMFQPVSDVFLKVSFQGSDGGAQHLNFGGVVPGGAGTLVGPGVGPGSALTATAVSGASSIEAGTRAYAYSFVTPAGESLTAPARSIATGPVPDPPLSTPPNASMTPTGSPLGPGGTRLTVGDQVAILFEYHMGAAYATPHTAVSAYSPLMTVVSNNDPLNPTDTAPITMSFPYSTDPRITWIHIYLYSQAAGAIGWWKIEANVPTGGTLNVTRGGGSGYGNYAQPPSAANTTGAAIVNLSNIGIGPATVTARKLYRTLANAGQLKLLTTLANNTATTYSDSAADSTLGANAPAVDTSGLQQPDGQVAAGSTSLPIAGASAFETGGGWAIIGNGEQVIRYTGVTAVTLIGIPASGPGAITATIAYNSTVTAAPMLTGIPASGLRSLNSRALVAGDELYLVVQVDSAPAQAALRAAVGGTGIREEWVQDRRLSIGEARARGQATLGVRPLGARRVAYTSRDLRTRSGQTITVNLPAPTNVTGAFKIQQVIISNFRPYPNQPPTYAVQASSVRFSFEDLLRSIKTKE